MSYNIAVVNFKLPEKFEEADELINSMIDIDVDEIEPIYKEFHDKVTKYSLVCAACQTKKRTMAFGVMAR